MSLFGSRQEDPLLQDDPFAPSSEDTEHSPSRDALGSADESGTDSVFRPLHDRPPSQDPPSRQHRTIHRSAQSARAGRLRNLNAAFDDGWRLDRMELQSDPPPESGSTDAVTIAFVLCRRDGA